MGVLLILGGQSAEAQTVTDIRPEWGVAGDTIEIYGTGLGTVNAAAVTIGGQSVVSIVTESSSLLTVQVPSVSGPSIVSAGDPRPPNDSWEYLVDRRYLLAI